MKVLILTVMSIYIKPFNAIPCHYQEPIDTRICSKVFNDRSNQVADVIQD